MTDELEKVRAGLGALAIFPLPNAVLLPFELLPLHIFEPRYRRMIADVLEAGRPLALARLAPGWDGDYEGRPAVEPVCGVGLVTRHEALPDGRSNILVKGIARVRIEAELDNGKPYREVRARLLEDATGPGDLADEVESLKRMLFALCANRPGPAANALAHLAARTTVPGALADVVAAAVLVDGPRRQEALVTTDVRARLQLVQAALAELLVGAVPRETEPGLLN